MMAYANVATYDAGPGKPGLRSGRALSRMDAIGGYITRMLICKPCKKKSKRTSQLDPIEIPFEPASPTPDMEQALDDDLDDIVARIDAAVDAQEKAASLLHSAPNDPPGLYTHCDTATTASDGVIAVVSKSDEENAIEATLRSFDLEAATKYTDFDEGNLGKQHSSMHVRHCNSRTCNVCQREEGVYFIKPKSGP